MNGSHIEAGVSGGTESGVIIVVEAARAVVDTAASIAAVIMAGAAADIEGACCFATVGCSEGRCAIRALGGRGTSSSRWGSPGASLGAALHIPAPHLPTQAPTPRPQPAATAVTPVTAGRPRMAALTHAW